MSITEQTETFMYVVSGVTVAQGSKLALYCIRKYDSFTITEA